MRSYVNFKIVLKVVSRNLIILAIALFCCVGVCIVYHEDFFPFIASACVALSLGLILFYLTRKQSEDITISKRDAYLTVTLSWLTAAIIGSLPYVLSDAIPSVIDALFESTSGFTTTGSSILTDIESLPKSILFWRSLTHWMGGIGFIVVVIIVMPTLQFGGYHLFTLESSLQEKIKPSIKSVGVRLLMIYLLLTMLEIVFLMAGKMDLYNSVCHAFGTVATGGFSPRNTSIAEYSPYIQYVVMVFMLLSGMNFVIHYYFLKRQFHKIKENEEVKLYLLLIAMIGSVATLTLFITMNKPLEESFREAFFQVISIITCTGYATADYLEWPAFAWMLIFFSMFLGGSTGSTAGGIKIARHLVLLKNIRRETQRLLSPHAVLSIRLNGTSVNEETNSTIITFITIYVAVFLIGSLLMVMTGTDGVTAASAVATCMAGIGPGMGTVGPASNFAHLPELGKLLLSFLMIVGRLEIYTVIMLFSHWFWAEP